MPEAHFLHPSGPTARIISPPSGNSDVHFWDLLKLSPGLWLTSGILSLAYWEPLFTSRTHFLGFTFPTLPNATSTPVSRTQSPLPTVHLLSFPFISRL